MDFGAVVVVVYARDRGKWIGGREDRRAKKDFKRVREGRNSKEEVELTFSPSMIFLPLTRQSVYRHF